MRSLVHDEPCKICVSFYDFAFSNYSEPLFHLAWALCFWVWCLQLHLMVLYCSKHGISSQISKGCIDPQKLSIILMFFHHISDKPRMKVLVGRPRTMFITPLIVPLIPQVGSTTLAGLMHSVLMVLFLYNRVVIHHGSTNCKFLVSYLTLPSPAETLSAFQVNWGMLNS